MQLPSNEKAKYIDVAKFELEQRSAGAKVGSLISDPRFTAKVGGAIQTPQLLKEKKSPNIVVYCHAFSDAPCTLPSETFKSLTSPLVSTRRILSLLQNVNAQVFVKTHPKPFPQDEIAINDLLSEFPAVSRLESSLTPVDLHLAGIDLVITGWGSVCFEASYIGLPVVAYSSFSYLSQLGILPIIDIDHPDSFFVAITNALNSPTQHFDLSKIAEAYVIATDCLNYDLTSSDLAILGREGVNGRYSPYAYQFWTSTLNREKFDETNNALRYFFERRETVFSSVFVESLRTHRK